MEAQTAVQDHKHDADDGDRRADPDKPGKAFPGALQKLCKDDRKQRGQRNDDRNACGLIPRNRDRGVLEIEVYASAGDAEQHEHQLVLPRETDKLRTHQKQYDVCERHADRRDLHRGEARVQKVLRHHVAASPDRNGEQRKQMRPNGGEMFFACRLNLFHTASCGISRPNAIIAQRAAFRNNRFVRGRELPLRG